VGVCPKRRSHAKAYAILNCRCNNSTDMVRNQRLALAQLLHYLGSYPEVQREKIEISDGWQWYGGRAHD
jgi:hypothetical protein